MTLNRSTLVAALDSIVSGFAPYVATDENLFGSSSSLHAVFAAFSHFVREREIDAAAWSQLAAFVSSAAESDDQMSEAVCTCFLENLADPSHPLDSLLSGYALDYWKQWRGQTSRSSDGA